MTRSRNSYGTQERSPGDRAGYWSKRREAYLASSFNVPVSYLITTRAELDAPLTEIELTTSHGRRKSPEDDERFSVDWLLQNYTSPNQELNLAINSFTHIFGYQPLSIISREPPKRPYRDVISLNGEAEISPADDEKNITRLGMVVGLTIVAGLDLYPVWRFEDNESF